MPSLIGKILINKALPSKREILGSVGKLVKDTVKNPKKIIKDGLARDKAAVALYKSLTGKGRLETAKEVVIKASKGAYKGGGKDLMVNTGGAVGSVIGAANAGVVGKLGGDYVGAGIARRALDDIEAVGGAIGDLKKEWRKMSWYRKGKLVQRRSMERAKLKRKNAIPEYKKDAIGWGIGNSSAEALQSAGSHIPLQGGIVAMNTVEPIYKGLKVAKRLSKSNSTKDSLRKGMVVTGRNLRKTTSVKRRIKKGNAREKVMYDSVNKELQTLPTLPKGTNFKRNIF